MYAWGRIATSCTCTRQLHRPFMHCTLYDVMDGTHLSSQHNARDRLPICKVSKTELKGKPGPRKGPETAQRILQMAQFKTGPRDQRDPGWPKNPARERTRCGPRPGRVPGKSRKWPGLKWAKVTQNLPEWPAEDPRWPKIPPSGPNAEKIGPNSLPVARFGPQTMARVRLRVRVRVTGGLPRVTM